MLNNRIVYLLRAPKGNPIGVSKSVITVFNTPEEAEKMIDLINIGRILMNPFEPLEFAGYSICPVSLSELKEMCKCPVCVDDHYIGSIRAVEDFHSVGGIATDIVNGNRNAIRFATILQFDDPHPQGDFNAFGEIDIDKVPASQSC